MWWLGSFVEGVSERAELPTAVECGGCEKHATSVDELCERLSLYGTIGGLTSRTVKFCIFGALVKHTDLSGRG